MNDKKYIFELDGLDCADCALKIENKLKDQSNFENVHLNFVNKSVSLVILDGNEDENYEKVKKIVQDFEPHVSVNKKEVKKNILKKEYILNGLICANCAQKIEDKLNKFENIDSAVIDFSNQKLVVNGRSLEEINQDIKSLVEKIEPDVKVVEKVEDEDIKETKKIDYNIKKLSRLLVGFAIFLSAIYINNINIELPLFIIAYLIVGYDILYKAFSDIKNGQLFDENFLMTIATFGAFGIREYPEAVAVMLFYQFGEYLEGLAVNKSRKSISELMDIKPEYANLIVGNKVRKINPEDVSVGDTIQVKPGEKVPLDGKIIKGGSSFDTVALTGESVPKKLKKGDKVLSGYINTEGLVNIEVTNTFEDSTVSKILELVENTSSKKAPTEKFITKFAKYYTPLVVLAASLIVAIPVLFLNQPFNKWLYRALIFLVISCPCALVVSIPLGFFSGIGRASKSGILIKGGNYLEALKNVTDIIFDKTGTLTEGVFKVQNIVPFNGYTQEEVIEYAAYVEKFSNHPIAKSIVQKHHVHVDESFVKNYTEVSGKGVKAEINGKKVLVGNKKLLKDDNIKFKDVKLDSTVVYVAIDNKFAGHIEIADDVKADSKEAIQGLKKLGIKDIMMLTGDNENIAKNISEKLGIDKYYAELLPQEKVELMEKLELEKKKGRVIAFVGDGINDAPVIKRSDVGIAMGALGSDAAIEAADVVILNDEPSKLIDAIKISNVTNKIVWQNIILALGIKLAVMFLGTIGYASIQAAVFADVGVALLAVMNSLRILKA